MVTPFYSWVLPIKDEALSLPQLFGEIKRVMAGKTFELIAIDDASSDSSLAVLTKLAKQLPLTTIHFNTHQGKWMALAEGLKKAKGKIIITLDSDLQDDPKEVGKLLQKLNQGYELVSGWRQKRFDQFYKVFISKLGNQLVSLVTGHRFYDLNSPFKVYNASVLSSLPWQGSLLRFTMLFGHRLGYNVAEVPVNHRPRLYGKSKFGVIKYFRIFYDLILVLLLFTGSGRLRKVKGIR